MWNSCCWDFRYLLFKISNKSRTEHFELLKWWLQTTKTHLFTSIRFHSTPLISGCVLSSKKEFHMCLLIFPIIFNSIHSIFHASLNWAHVRFVNKNTNCETIQIVIYGDATLFRWHSFSFSIYLRFVGRKKYSP